MRDQLAHESVVVLEGDDALVLIACSRLRELHLLPYQPFYPKTDGAGEYRERSDSYLASALSASPRIRPGKESKNAPRIPLVITEVEVIGGRVVEVYGTLDEPETEDAGVEVEIPLGIARDTGDVVNTGSAEAHRIDSCLAILRDLALIGARTRRSLLTPVTALLGVAVALLCRGSRTLFPLSSGWHNISNLYPPNEATDMPFAEALM
jgi:hypothetical protein